MNAQPVISVIIPVYNVEAYLERCVNSVLAQTFQDIEIILINDGSTDGSLAICQALADQHDIITLKSQDNGGLSAARNHGIDIARGDFLYFCDSDDYIEPTLCETLITALRRDASQCVCCGFRTVNARGDVLKQYSIVDEPLSIDLVKRPEQLFNMFLEGRYGTYNATNKLYVKAIVDSHQIRFWEAKNIAEDFDFNLAYLSHCQLMSFMPNILYNYMMNDVSITRGYVKGVLKKHLDWRKMLQDHLPDAMHTPETMHKLAIQTAKNLIFAMSQEVVYDQSPNIVSFLHEALQLDDYKQAYRQVRPADLDSRNEQLLWLLLQQRQLHMFKFFSKLKYQLIRLRRK